MTYLELIRNAESPQVRMTLDEAIERFEKLASDYEFNLNMHKNHVMNLSVSDIERMQKYLEENRQLADWLRELQIYRKKLTEIEEAVDFYKGCETCQGFREYSTDKFVEDLVKILRSEQSHPTMACMED